jgi:DNA polymerase zeta
LRIADHLDIFGRSSELSRFYGMDIFSALTRGSQFRVEAVLLRICKNLGYLLLSPTRGQVAAQAAMEVEFYFSFLQILTVVGNAIDF